MLVYYIAVHVQGCGKGTWASFSMFQSRTSSHRKLKRRPMKRNRVGGNADHIIAGDGSVDAAHSKSFVYIGHTYLYSRSEELLQV